MSRSAQNPTPRPTLLVSLLVFGALIAAALAFATLAHADEDMKFEALIKLVLDDEHADVIELDASDMEIGDSRQLYTASGKEVVVTRGENGFEITVDGEDLDLPTVHQEKKVVIVKAHGEHDGEHQELHEVIIGGEGDHESHSVHKIVIGGEGEHGEHVFHHSGEGSHQMVFISEDGEATDVDIDSEGFAWAFGDGAKVMRVDGGSAAEHLEESGALDNLDEATRERILEALRQHQDGSKKVRLVVTGNGDGDGEPRER
jgi:hypothetical protein